MKTPFTLPGTRALTLAVCLATTGLAYGQTAAPQLNRALPHLQTQYAKLGLSAADVADPALTSAYAEESGVTHFYLRQRYQGLEIHGTESDLHLSASNKLVSLHSAFIANVGHAGRAAATVPTLTPVQAIAAAARALSIAAPGNLTLEKAGEPAAGMVYSDGGISLQPIPVKLMYQQFGNGELVLVWDVTIDDKASDHYWNARVNATTGQLVDKLDYTVSEPTSFIELNAHALGTPGWPEPVRPDQTNAPNSYNVYPVTVESPLHGTRQVVVNPADATYSPFGWHDTNGVAGAEYTITRGNNVHAYEDRNRANAPGYSPDGGTDLIFDYPFDQAALPIVSQNAAITNLFYWNNLVHDIMAYKGFTEVAGNFQVRNYTGQGLGNDDVRAEAQDGGGINNANFSTPNDGSRPRMQMYLWPGSTTRILAPSSLAGPVATGASAYGRSLLTTGPITGNVVMANDGSDNPVRGCNPFLNAAAINGNIAMVYRGKCEWGPKIRNAQAAGARLVLLVDSIANNPIPYVSYPTTNPSDTIGIRVPSIVVSKIDGDRMRQALEAGVPVRLTTSYLSRDGDYDNGVIAHEYGHGISTRLTGGPAVSNCLSNAEQMGEGWSDFFGLWLTTKPSDKGTTPRGIGNYVKGQNIDGPGIRPQRYSTDWAVNNQTYAMVGVAPYTAVHAIGSIWCATLWDLNWALIGKYGYNQNLKATTGGNNIALKLVLDGCKLQVCRPGLLDGRDAILRADSLYNNAANAMLIWQVFARRGMGIDAIQGSSNNLNDQVAGYMLPTVVTSAQKGLANASLDVYPNPAQNQLTLHLPVSGNQPITVTLLTVTGKEVVRTSVEARQLQQEGAKLDISQLTNGLYLVRLDTPAGIVTKKVLVQH